MGRDKDDALNVEEFDVDAGDDDLDDAMRDALEAVEASGRGREDGDGRNGEQDDSNQLAELRREVVELRDRSVRTLADFDNFRKRVERERREQQQYAGSEILREVLDVVDNLERAVAASGGQEDLQAGVDLILRQVQDMLRRHGVEKVETEGRAFDPSVHEAVSRQESAEVSAPTVQQELQPGYVMKDRLLRPAMVVVAVPAPAAEEEIGAD
jgi:molecular chaperone GrpE